MRLWLYALGMCQSMFCALPFPWHGWEEKARDRMLLCLPLIGLEIGFVWWGLAMLCIFWKLPQPLRAMVLAAAPYLLTGFMHLDGFMDVTDAVRSYRSLERRREILKDSHVGSFAVICLVLLAMAGYSVWSCPAEAGKLWALPLVCAGVRCVSAGAVLGLKPLETSGYHAMGQSRGGAAAAWILGAVAVGLGVLVPGWGFLAPGAATLVAGVAVLSLRRNVGGMCGDISGAAITLGELAGSAALLLL